MPRISESAKVRVSKKAVRKMYPQPKERRVLGHLVVREVTRVDNLHDLPVPTQQIGEDILAHRRGRRLWVVRDSKSRGGLTLLVTNGGGL